MGNRCSLAFSAIRKWQSTLLSAWHPSPLLTPQAQQDIYTHAAYCRQKLKPIGLSMCFQLGMISWKYLRQHLLQIYSTLRKSMSGPINPGGKLLHTNPRLHTSSCLRKKSYRKYRIQQAVCNWHTAQCFNLRSDPQNEHEKKKILKKICILSDSPKSASPKRRVH